MNENDKKNDDPEGRQKRLQDSYPKLSGEYQLYVLGQAEGIRVAQEPPSAKNDD
jgi:hypothetical protein